MSIRNFYEKNDIVRYLLYQSNKLINICDTININCSKVKLMVKLLNSIWFNKNHKSPNGAIQSELTQYLKYLSKNKKIIFLKSIFGLHPHDVNDILLENIVQDLNSLCKERVLYLKHLTSQNKEEYYINLLHNLLDILKRGTISRCDKKYIQEYNNLAKTLKLNKIKVFYDIEEAVDNIFNKTIKHGGN